MPVDLTNLAPAGQPVDAQQFVAALDLRPRAPRGVRVVAAMIASVDGRATLDGRAGGLGNPADRALLRELRAAADAVLVGRATLTVERYASLLDPPQRERRVAAGRPENPVAVTITQDVSTLAGVPLVDEPVPFVAYTPADPDDPPPGNLEVRVRGDVSPAAVVADLHERDGAELIVCEGGPHLLRGLAADGVLDDLVLTVSPTLIAGESPTILAGDSLPTPIGLSLGAVARAGEHLMLHYTR